MQGLISEEFYNILNQISDQNFDLEHIISVFRKEIPVLAKKNGIILMKTSIHEPIKRSDKMQVTEIVLFDNSNGRQGNQQVLEFPIGNGGFVVVRTAIPEENEWTDDNKRDNYVIARTIYLLTGRAKTMATLLNLSFVDQVTGIPNESGLTRFMGKTIAQSKFDRYCTNFINIKNMKLINSRYGEEAGDEVLIHFARSIEQYATKQGNGIAARLGGDNFLVFIEASKQEAFIDYLQHVHLMHKRKSGLVVDIEIAVRVGYYYIQAKDTINDAMLHADIAAKVARKQNTPDFVKFELDMKRHILKIRQLEENIPSAIKNQEFVVYYQAKADISNREAFKTSGAEALVRWKKDGEMISPGEFIPVLEKSGLITLIDFYVFERICLDIKDWISRGITPVKVSSNFSRRHLQDQDFAGKIEQILKRHQVDPKYIEIEITESYDNDDMQALTTFEKRMHELGIQLSVDDFGSGFSSLKMIKNIVADTIKLDKSIVDGIGENSADDIIVSHIINMINSLGKGLIAEGVETEKQADFLRENGCKYIQGFLYTRPCPKEEFEKYIK